MYIFNKPNKKKKLFANHNLKLGKLSVGSERHLADESGFKGCLQNARLSLHPTSRLN